jgi:hypothetical protein
VTNPASRPRFTRVVPLANPTVGSARAASPACGGPVACRRGDRWHGRLLGLVDGLARHRLRLLRFGAASGS